MCRATKWATVTAMTTMLTTAGTATSQGTTLTVPTTNVATL